MALYMTETLTLKEYQTKRMTFNLSLKLKSSSILYVLNWLSTSHMGIYLLSTLTK